MMEYAFDTITPEQALNIKLGDTLTINGGPARNVAVVYQSYDPAALTPEVPSILLSFGGHTVKFGTGLTQLADVGAIVMADGSKLFVGDTGDERTTGADGDDGLYGGPGMDSLIGQAGDDLLHGGSGDDVLVGGQGHDMMYGGQGDDIIYCSQEINGAAGEAGDFAHGNLGNDEIYGGAGADTLYGGQGDDLVFGADGDDFINGDLGNDELHGGLGDDTLNGGAGNDTLQGDLGSDVLFGGDGDDMLVARGGDSGLVGGDGADTLVASGAGRDMLWGGEGRDRFEFVATTPPAPTTDDVIMDWESSDSLAFFGVGIASILPRSYSEFVASDYASALATANEHISAAGVTYVAAQISGGVVVFVDTGDPVDGADIAVVLIGKTLADIDLSNFV